MKLFDVLSLAVAGLVLPQPALGSPENWTSARSGAEVSARLTLGDARAIVAQCAEGQFSLVIEGLPFENDQFQAVAFTDPSGRMRFQNFSRETVVSGSGAQPISFARLLSVGGTLSHAPRDGEPAWSAVPVPASNGALEQTLGACGHAQVDERVLRFPAVPRIRGATEVSWAVQPRMYYPDRAIASGQEGYVGTSCIALPDGRLRDCVIERETPRGFGFGVAFRRSLEGARLRTPVAEDPSRGTVVWFGQRWLLPNQ